MKKKWAIETHFPEFKWIFYDFNNLTEITRIKLFRYASNYCVCEFISEPWERLHEFQIEYISAIEKKKREDKISLYL